MLSMYIGKKCSVPFGRWSIACRFIISVLASEIFVNDCDNSCKYFISYECIYCFISINITQFPVIVSIIVSESLLLELSIGMKPSVSPVFIFIACNKEETKS